MSNFKTYRNKETGEIVRAYLERKARSERNVMIVFFPDKQYQYLVNDFKEMFEEVSNDKS